MPPPSTGSDCVWGAQTRRVMPLGILQAIVTVRPDALASAMKRLHQEGLPASRDAGGAPLPKGPVRRGALAADHLRDPNRHPEHRAPRTAHELLLEGRE